MDYVCNTVTTKGPNYSVMLIYSVLASPLTYFPYTQERDEGNDENKETTSDDFLFVTRDYNKQ